MGVKSWLMQRGNPEKYLKGSKLTGPIDNTRAYKEMRRHKESSVEPIIYCKDDPYWRRLFLKNLKREYQYKLPSQYVWDHRPHGIIGEVLDIKKLEQNNKYLSYFV
jgi:hypothetical protein